MPWIYGLLGTLELRVQAKSTSKGKIPSLPVPTSQASQWEGLPTVWEMGGDHFPGGANSSVLFVLLFFGLFFFFAVI